MYRARLPRLSRVSVRVHLEASEVVDRSVRSKEEEGWAHLEADQVATSALRVQLAADSLVQFCIEFPLLAFHKVQLHFRHTTA